jgi:crotonobetainyl-CoA:carnitine CoA-transferase CaiB-like acyl-CoA transferase
MKGVLQGIRILDFSRYLAGPYATMLLAAIGAEVIRIEPPGGGEDRTLGPQIPATRSSVAHLIINRGKKGITLNLNAKKGRQLLEKLVKVSDVVVENFSPQLKRALGLNYEILSQINPSIILVSISAFGESGPNCQYVGFDPVFQAFSGAMGLTGFPGNPPTRARVPFIDLGTALSAAWSILVALYHRKESGEGQKIELSLADTAVAFSTALPALYKVFGMELKPIGNSAYFTFSDCFKAKDGWVVLSPLTNPIFKRFARILGREDIARDPRFKDDMSRFEHRQILASQVSQWVAERTVDEVVKLMQQAKVPCGAVYTVPQLLSDPHIKAREMMVEVDYPEVGPVPMPGFHVRFSKTPGKTKMRAPNIGEHNEEIYGHLLGLDHQEMEQLQREGAI